MPREPKEQRPIQYRVADFLRDYWLDALLIIVPVLAAVAGLVASDEFTHWITKSQDEQQRIRDIGIRAFFGSAGVQIILAGVNLRHAKRVSALENRIADEKARADAAISESAAWVQDIYSLCDGFLYVMSTTGALDLKPTDRISIYAHDPTNDTFLKLARYSPNEEFRKMGRRSYPVNQGCIGRAWTDDECHIAEFPSRVDGAPAFFEECARYNISREVASQLRMRSKFYYGKKIRDSSGIVALGVVIIESESPRRFQMNGLRAVFDGPTGKHLRDMMSRLAPRIPRSRIATEAGF